MEGVYQCHLPVRIWDICPRHISDMPLMIAGYAGGNHAAVRTCKVCGATNRNQDGTVRIDVFYTGTRHLVCKACKAAAYAAKKEAKHEVD